MPIRPNPPETFEPWRLVDSPDPGGDWWYRFPDTRPVRRNPPSAKAHRRRGAEENPFVEPTAAQKAEALRRYKVRRGCPDWVPDNYVRATRSEGGWWYDRPPPK